MNKEILKSIKVIECIIPFYLKSQGDCTKIYIKDKYLIFKMPIMRSLEYIYKEFRYEGIENKIYKAEIGKIIGLKEKSIIILSHKNVLFRLKVRNSRVKNDSTYGYFNIKMVKEIRKLDKKRSLIRFKSGLELAVLTTVSRVEELKKISELIYLLLVQEREIEYLRKKLNKESSLFYDYYFDYYLDT